MKMVRQDFHQIFDPHFKHGKSSFWENYSIFKYCCFMMLNPKLDGVFVTPRIRGDPSERIYVDNLLCILLSNSTPNLHSQLNFS